MKSFADDTHATKGVRSVEDVRSLQESLQKLYDWSDQNNMLLNDGKIWTGWATEGSYTLHRSLSKNDWREKVHQRSWHPSIWRQFFQVPYQQHIEKARNMILWILRTFKTRSPMPILTIFKMLVLPIFEYCYVLWSPTDIGSIRSLEEIQRSVVRKIICDGDD